MSTVFIFHGTGGHPEENWFPWMKTKLEEHHYRVIVPQMPNSDHPTLDKWMQHMQRYEASVDEETIFIGHSLGAAFALRLLEHMPQYIRGAYLVAPVWCELGNSFDGLNRSFIEQPFDWEAIKEHCSRFHILQSDNDPYITGELSYALAKNLDVSVSIIPSAGHFNASAGYTKFPELLTMILSK